MTTRNGATTENGSQSSTQTNKQHRPYISLPRIISIKKDAFLDLSAFLEQLKTGSEGLCVCDSLTKKIAGESIRDTLQDQGYSLEFFEIVRADKETMEKATEHIKKEGMDFVLGVGGGRPIDIAKTASHKSGTYFISIPTAPSHDGVASNIASITFGRERVSISAHPPHAVVADIGLISQAPHRLLASGCGDVASNSSAILDWKLGRDTRNENYSRYASAISQMSFNILNHNVNLLKFRGIAASQLVMDALIASGMAMSICGNSRPASGGEHLISHALDRTAKTPGLHGEQCGLASIFTLYLHDGNWQEVRRILKMAGAPMTLKQLGVSEEEFIHAVELAPKLRPSRFTILHLNLTKARIQQALRETKLLD